jgi:hypothetical protein
MNRYQKGVISFAFVFIALTIGVGFFYPGQKSITGLAIFSSECGDSINSAGSWDLNASLSCSSGNGISLNASNIVLNCQNFYLTGGDDDNSIGIQVSSDLSNVSIQNCNITGFYDPISIDSNSELGIMNSFVKESNTCITGDWADNGGNTGCLDTKGPSITVSTQSIRQNQSLIYQIEASDPSGIANYSEDSSNFTINSSGILTNSTELTIQSYSVNISVTDTLGFSSSTVLTIEVSAIPDPTPEDDSSNDDSSSGGSSGGSSDSSSSQKPKKKKELKDCSVDEAWNCIAWSECVDGEQKRSCSRKDDNCNTPLPLTTQSCIDIVPEIVEEEEEPEVQQLEIKEEEPEQNPAITGGAITALDKLKELKNPVLFIRNNLLAFVSLLAILIGFILAMALNRKTKVKLSKRALVTKDKIANTKDDSKKLWDWEDKNQSANPKREKRKWWQIGKKK